LVEDSSHIRARDLALSSTKSDKPNNSLGNYPKTLSGADHFSFFSTTICTAYCRSLAIFGYISLWATQA